VAPALVITCEYDPLRDEGQAYAATLDKAGVAGEARCYEGMIHGVFSMTTVVPAAQAIMETACTALRQALS